MQRGDVTRVFSYEPISVQRLTPSNGPPRGDFDITVIGRNFGDTAEYGHKGTVSPSAIPACLVSPFSDTAIVIFLFCLSIWSFLCVVHILARMPA